MNPGVCLEIRQWMFAPLFAEAPHSVQGVLWQEVGDNPIIIHWTQLVIRDP